MNIELVNAHTVGHSVGEYCGRGSPLGNPHPKGPDKTRDQACDEYQQTFERWVREGRPDKMAELHRLRAIYESTGSLQLRCFCFPKRCHTATIRNWLLDNSFQDDSHHY